MHKIELYGENGKGRSVIVDSDDYDLLSTYRWNLATLGYPITRYKGKLITMHKLIFLLRDIKSDMKNHIDHIDGDKLNNRKTNLRLCSPSENLFNRGPQKNNHIGLKGAYARSNGRYYSRIKAYGVDYYLGDYATAKEAAKAYYLKSKELHGEYAWEKP